MALLAMLRGLSGGWRSQWNGFIKTVFTRPHSESATTNPSGHQLDTYSLAMNTMSDDTPASLRIRLLMAL